MGGVPVNVLPKTNSLGGTSSLGVVVLVIDSLDTSISCSFTVDAAVALILYVLEAINFEGDCLKRAAVGLN